MLWSKFLKPKNAVILEDEIMGAIVNHFDVSENLWRRKMAV